LPRSPASEARARYYLGQSYYFAGKNREALFEFLLVQSQYGAEANDWIRSLLPNLSSTTAD
jgi:TolA-binding protein